MNRLEQLRDKLYNAMESGKSEDILRISKELDKEILKYVQQDMKNNAVCLGKG